MRRGLLFALVAGMSLAAASTASAGPAGRLAAEATPGSESISLKYGVGYAVLSKRGAVLGRVRRGAITVVDVAEGGEPSGFVRGCEHRSGRLATKLVCRGSDLSFYVHGGTWKVRIEGRGINVSGVVRGIMGLDRADGGTGRYSIGDAPYRRWPAALRFFRIGQ
jgi:hypothetical protein